jgi:alkanesulfonate monooxygenase SsuD/methylene tetrahydromethanopterin reductase-like flavin-dependent oxidoreductase (luciferase family)
MRFSLWVGLTEPWADVLDGVQHAERTGWDGVYVADHFMADANGPFPPDTPNLEATAAISALAAATDRVQLATLVFGITYRHPAVLAKWAATTDHVSDGRLLLGLGAGWQENEHEQYGIELGPPGVRVERFAEALQVIRGLLDQETTTVAGEHYQVTDAIALPNPVQDKLPILIGAKGDRMLGLVAEHADAWNMWSNPEDLAERRAVLDRHCERIGRDPGQIATSTQAVTIIMDDAEKGRELEAAMGASRPAVAGPAEHFAERVAAWRDAGADEIIVPDFALGGGTRRSDAMDAIIERVAPEFR